jgi:alanine racemase
MHASAMIRRTRVEVDLAAIVGNARSVAAIARTDVVAVVKADAYGHGAIAVAQALSKARAASGFAVSLVEEGIALREAGVSAPVLVMGPSQHGGEGDMVAAKLTPVIGAEEDLPPLAAVAPGRFRRASGGHRCTSRPRRHPRRRSDDALRLRRH